MSVKDRVQKISYNQNLYENYLPTSAKIEVSGICTLNCEFCYQNVMKKNNIRQHLISDDQFLEIISFLDSVPSISEVGLFYMGESSLHEKLAKYYYILKQKKYFTYLTTNATNIKNVIESISFIDSLKISWNYKNADDFQKKTHKNKVLYYKIIENTKIAYNACHAYNKKLTVSTILDDKKEKYERSLSKLMYDDHYWIPLQTQCGTNNHGLGGVVGESDNIRTQLPCWSLFKGLYIDSDLNVRTCCYGHYNEHILYNINNQKEFILTKKLLNMRKMHLLGIIPDECRSCLKNQS